MNTNNLPQVTPPQPAPVANLTSAEIDQVKSIMERFKAPIPVAVAPVPTTPVTSSAAPVSTPPTTISAPQRLTKEQYDKIMTQAPIQVEQMLENNPKLKEEFAKQVAYDRAEREPLPDIIETAFNSTTLEVKLKNETVTLRKLVAGDWMIFKKTSSPIYQTLMGSIKDIDCLMALAVPDEKQFELIYQFTRPCIDCCKLVSKDAALFTSTAVEEIGCKYDLDDAELLVGAILKHIGITLQAKSQVADNTPEDEDKKKQA